MIQYQLHMMLVGLWKILYYTTSNFIWLTSKIVKHIKKLWLRIKIYITIYAIQKFNGQSSKKYLANILRLWKIAYEENLDCKFLWGKCIYFAL